MHPLNRGFTLVEMGLALAVAAICLGCAIPAITGQVSAAHFPAPRRPAAARGH